MLTAALFLFFALFNLFINAHSSPHLQTATASSIMHEVSQTGETAHSNSLGVPLFLGGNDPTAFNMRGMESKLANPVNLENFTSLASALVGVTQPSISVSLGLDRFVGDDYGPRQDLERPADAVELEPGDDIDAVISRHPAGTIFLLKAGVYRLQSIHLREGDVLVGEYGAELNGSRLVTEVQREGEYWVLPGQTQEGDPFDKCFPEFPACKYPEQVFLDDQMLTQVLSLPELRPGAFYFDYRRDKIYLADSPEGKKLEVSVTPQAIEGAPGAVIRNLVITKYAQEGDWMTVRLFPNMVAEYNDITFNAGVGLSLSHNVYAHHNRIRYSGRMGVLDVESENIRLEYNEIAYNNTFGYDYHWEAGGSKFLRTRNLKVTHNYVHRNFGPGLWTDYDNHETLYEHNLVSHNTGNGIFHEVSGSAVIRFNEVNHNGTNGIEIANSSDTDVYGNVLRGNASSLWAKNACRPAAETFTLKNVRFYDNVVYQDAHHAGTEDWPTGKAAALFSERNCKFWSERFEDWFNSVGNLWYDNTYYVTNLHSDARPPFLWKENEVQLEDWQEFGLQ